MLISLRATKSNNISGKGLIRGLGLWSATAVAIHNGIRFDLNQPIRVDEAHDLHDRVRGADAAKELAVDCRDAFPILYTGQQNSCSGHVRKFAAEPFNR